MCAIMDEESGCEEDPDSEEAMLCFTTMEENNDKFEDNAPTYDDLIFAFEELQDMSFCF